MKLWEVLKALDENPNKRFKSVNYNQEEIIISMGVDCYDLPFRVIDSNRDWQEVKPPVPLQEAFEAWANGKRIRCVIGKAEYIFGRSPYREFQDQNDYGLAVEHITKGTWYIED